MKLHATPEGEARALRVAAHRAGCVVRELAIRPTSAGMRAVGYVECPDGWAAARMLLAAAIEDAKTPGARDLALRLRANARTDEEFARAVHEYVKENVAFVREQGELFQNTGYTLAIGAGDCDDHARAVYAIALAGGVPAMLALLHHGGRRATPTHAVAQLCPDGACAWAETTVDAEYGEHPLAAAQRHGLVNARQDLAKEVKIVNERELFPAPAGYVAANPQAAVAADVDAFLSLGYLDDESAAEIRGPSHPAFRNAVARFQIAHGGLTVDGLIGPKTRAAIASVLVGEHRMGYLGSIATATDPSADIPTEFLAGVKTMSAEYGFDPEWVLNVMKSESDIKPSAAYRNPPHFATGLIGFVGLKELGAAPDNSRESHDAFAKLTHMQQLPFVRKFWAPLKGRVQSAANLYQYNFLPASLARGTGPETILAAKGGTGYNGQEGMFYDLNRLLDVDKDGVIYVADLDMHLQRQKKGARWTSALARMNAVEPGPIGPAVPVTKSVVGPIVAGLLGVVALGSVAAAASTWR